MTPLEFMISRIMKRMKVESVSKLNVQQYMIPYSIGKNLNSKSLKVKPLYKIGFAKPIEGLEDFTILDKKMVLERGINQLTLCDCRKSIRLERKDTWIDFVKGRFVRIMPKLNAKEFFEIIKELQIPWVELLNHLLDDTGKKDRRIIEIAKATYFPFEMSENRFWNSVNNHSIIVTNTGTGKSTTYARITGRQPSSDYSIPGLIGTVDNVTKGTYCGSLAGKGLYVFDEFPQKADSKLEIITSLLNYIESGEASRDLAGREKITCRGTKTLIFLGNVPGEYDEKGFEEIIVKLGGINACGRVGRRMAHILFRNDYAEVNALDGNSNQIDFLRYVLESAAEQGIFRIKKNLKLRSKWVESGDESHKDYMMSLCRLALFSRVKDFLKGHSRAYSKIKCGALKWALIQNLDKIFLEKDFRIVAESIKKDAEKMYEIFKKWNYESFEFLFEGRKGRVFELYEQGKTPKEISNEIGILLYVVNKWIDDFSYEKINGLGQLGDKDYALSPEDMVEEDKDHLLQENLDRQFGIDESVSVYDLKPINND